MILQKEKNCWNPAFQEKAYPPYPKKVKVKKVIKDVKAKSAERKSGRVATRVSLGYTTNPQTIKTIVEAVLKLDGFGKYKSSFSSINWKEYSSVTQGFKELIGILEKEKIGETQ